MKKTKVYCVRGAVGYARWIPNREIVNTIEEADLVVCPGGSDIDPRLYGETKVHPHGWGYSNMEHDSELREIKHAISLGKKIWGTCKGNQYQCALSGGKLIQDISHPGMHKILTEDGQTLVVNSMHHQMLYPFNLTPDKYRVIGWAENLSPHHEDGNGKEMNPPVEPEIVYFPETKMLGAQFHLEAMSEDNPTVKYCQNLLERFLEDKL